jgi:putative SOS response-associated peptidase YedK
MQKGGLSPAAGARVIAGAIRLLNTGRQVRENRAAMCNRYQLRASHEEVAALVGADVAGLNWPDEMFPRRPGLVVTSAGARLMDWGWPSPAGKGPPVTNVRNLDSPFWRAALADPARRCLIPGSAFCEWEGETGARRARWFGVNNAPVFAFAGIWRPHEGGGLYAMLTCAPNTLVASVHQKAMPVILPAGQTQDWLRLNWAAARRLVQPLPDAAMWLE